MTQTASTAAAPEGAPPASGRLVALVGCGFVGSVFLTEFLKRNYAGELACRFRFVDFDTVERRNAANQNFTLADRGYAKADVLSAAAVEFGCDTEHRVERLTLGNAERLLEGAALVVDGVDNLVTRQLLADLALLSDVPTLHVGITEDGTGKVEWSHPAHDTFSLSARRIDPAKVADPPSGVTKPCDLVRMRGVGLNVGLAAAKAASIYLGFDPEGHLDQEQHPAGWFTDWTASPTGHAPLIETWSHLDGRVFYEPPAADPLALARRRPFDGQGLAGIDYESQWTPWKKEESHVG